MALSFPLVHSNFLHLLPVRSMTFMLDEAVETSETGGGEILQADLGTGLWQGEITLGKLPLGEADEAVAAIEVARGPGRSVLLVRGYDPRHAPVEIHRALFDPLSRNLVAAPHLVLRGYIDRVTLTTPPKGGSGDVQIEIASQARALTRALNRYRSNASRIAAVPGDTFRKWATSTYKIKVNWGSGKTKSTGGGDVKPVNPFPASDK